MIDEYRTEWSKDPDDKERMWRHRLTETKGIADCYEEISETYNNQKEDYEKHKKTHCFGTERVLGEEGPSDESLTPK
jgi:hypothetical protein